MGVGKRGGELVGLVDKRAAGRRDAAGALLLGGVGGADGGQRGGLGGEGARAFRRCREHRAPRHLELYTGLNIYLLGISLKVDRTTRLGFIGRKYAQLLQHCNIGRLYQLRNRLHRGPPHR